MLKDKQLNQVFRYHSESAIQLRNYGFLTDAEYEKVSTRIQKWRDKIVKKKGNSSLEALKALEGICKNDFEDV